MTRLFVVGVLFATLVPATGSAQRVRDFEDSWFWGVKGGVSAYSPTYGTTKAAPTYGVEWLITRTHGALYVSVDEANLQTTTAVFDPTAPNSIRSVGIEKLRRVGFAGLVFPKRFGQLRPYAGLGLTINVVNEAYPILVPGETDAEEGVYQRIDESRSQAAWFGMGGVQAQLRRVAVFGQASYVPANTRFLVSDGMGFLEFGVRYNLSSAREGIR